MPGGLTFDKLLRAYLDPREVLARRFPKAAKKRRVQKKWKTRHPYTIQEGIHESIYFLAKIPKRTDWQGGTVDIGYLLREARERDEWRTWQRALGRYPVFIRDRAQEPRPPFKRNYVEFWCDEL